MLKIIGIGSPHGADRAGWQLIERLSQRNDLAGHVCAVATPVEALNHLDRCEYLLLIDACHTDLEIGSVIRLQWPDRRLREHRSLSSHSWGVGETLALAEKLGRLPKTVVLLGLNVSQNEPVTCAEQEIPGLEDLEQRALREFAAWQIEHSYTQK